MQIHQLPAVTTAANADVFAVDNGTTTQKITTENLGKKITADALVRKNEFLASGTNLNDLTYGIYYLSGSRSYTNLPTGMTWGVLIHIGGQQICQIMINNSNLAFRAYASSWGNWHILS